MVSYKEREVHVASVVDKKEEEVVEEKNWSNTEREKRRKRFWATCNFSPDINALLLAGPVLWSESVNL